MIGAKRTCQACQAKVAAKAKWCPACGAELIEPTPVVVEPTPVADEPATVVLAKDAPEGMPPPPAPASRVGPFIAAAPSTPMTTATWVLASLLVVALIGVVLVFGLGHPASNSTISSSNQQTANSSRAVLLTRGASVTAQAFTYTAKTLDNDLAAAATQMTPAMAAKYGKQLTDAARKEIATRGEAHVGKVTASSVISMTADQAQLLELLVVTTTMTGNKGNLVTPYRMRVTLHKVGDTWLVADMLPF